MERVPVPEEIIASPRQDVEMYQSHFGRFKSVGRTLSEVYLAETSPNRRYNQPLIP